MKSTGIVRKIDDLGRIVLPIELRRTLEVSERDPLEIFIEDNTIILKKYQPACIFCGNAKDVVTYKGTQYLSGLYRGNLEEAGRRISRKLQKTSVSLADDGGFFFLGYPHAF